MNKNESYALAVPVMTNQWSILAPKQLHVYDEITLTQQGGRKEPEYAEISGLKTAQI